MHLTLAIHLLHWPSSTINSRPNMLFKLRCTSLHPQVPILPFCWSRSCPNILFKLHCPANQNAHSAFMPSGQVVAASLSSWQLLQSDKIGSLAYNIASWISIALKTTTTTKFWSIWLLWNLWFFTKIWTISQTEFSSDPYCSVRWASKSKGISRNAESMFPIGFLQGPCEMWIYSVNLEVTIHKVEKCKKGKTKNGPQNLLIR